MSPPPSTLASTKSLMEWMHVGRLRGVIWAASLTKKDKVSQHFENDCVKYILILIDSVLFYVVLNGLT